MGLSILDGPDQFFNGSNQLFDVIFNEINYF